MNKNLITIAIMLVILAIVVAQVAAVLPPKSSLPSGKPLESIWTLLQHLQGQITEITAKVDNIELTPEPKGDTGATGAQDPQGIQRHKGDKGDTDQLALWDLKVHQGQHQTDSAFYSEM